LDGAYKTIFTSVEVFVPRFGILAKGDLEYEILALDISIATVESALGRRL
jgi:hypothetical protein